MAVRFAGPSIGAALVAAGVLAASALAGSHDPRLRLTSAGMATARQALPTQVELGAAWSPQPPTRPPSSVISCPGLQPNESRLVLTGIAGNSFDEGPFRNVTGTVRVFRTVAQADASWAMTRGAKVLTCEESYLKREGEHVHAAGPFSYGSRLPVRSAGYQIVTTLTRPPAIGRSAPLTVRVYSDLLLISTGRTQQFVAFSGLGAPLSRAFVDRVARMLAAGPRPAIA
jgi:hypothetical protein